MKGLNPIVKIVALSSLFGVALSIGLLEYHYTFDPYTWLNPNKEDDFSRGALE